MLAGFSRDRNYAFVVTLRDEARLSQLPNPPLLVHQGRRSAPPRPALFAGLLPSARPSAPAARATLDQGGLNREGISARASVACVPHAAGHQHSPALGDRASRRAAVLFGCPLFEPAKRRTEASGRGSGCCTRRCCPSADPFPGNSLRAGGRRISLPSQPATSENDVFIRLRGDDPSWLHLPPGRVRNNACGATASRSRSVVTRALRSRVVLQAKSAQKAAS
jgi:hypothetical protein